MSCDEIKDMLIAYIDGELELEEESLVEDHLKACDSCRAEYEDYKAIVELLRTLPEEDPPVGYCKRLHKKLLNSKVRKLPGRWLKYGSIAAALVLVVGSAYFAGTRLRMGENNASYDSMPEVTDEAKSSGMTEYGMNAQAPGVDLADMDMESDIAYDMPEPESSGGSPNAVYFRSRSAEVTKELKIIKNGSVSVQTESFDEFINGVIDQVKGCEGYIEENNTDVVMRQDKALRYGYLKIRVPSDSFDAAIAYIEENGSISHKNVSETDVTKQYYDLDGQINNLKTQENNLKVLMANSQTVADTLQIENELRRIRTEIDSLTMDLSDIDDRASMSTISVDVEEVTKASISVPEGSNIWQRAGDGFINTANAVMDFLETLIVGLISLLPALAAVALVVCIVYVIYRLRKKIK